MIQSDKCYLLMYTSAVDPEIHYDISPLDRPPEQCFGYNYAHGRMKLVHAIHYLSRKYGGSQEAQAIEILSAAREVKDPPSPER